jgi:hypothetical protein
MQALMPGTDLILETFRRIGSDPAERVYVLMDGARFDDLPGMLAAVELSHRSLYRNVQDAELVRVGPWLVDPYREPEPATNMWGGFPLGGGETKLPPDEVAADTEAALKEGASNDDHSSSFHNASGNPDPIKQLEQVVDIARDAPAAVFWIGDLDLTEAKLWRHLRTLNMALIPKGYGENDPPLLEPGGETHDAMMFRHADGNVLAEVLPVLDAAQFSRVFGPAKALMFLAPDHPASDGSILRRAVLPDDAPPATPGMLKLSMEQMRGIEEIRLERSRLRISRYLREVAPEHTSGMSDSQLRRATSIWMDEARSHGVKSEVALGKFCYLQSISGGRAAYQPGVQEYLSSKDGLPADDRVGLLLRSVALAAKQRERSWER